ncbi:MAG: MFS transporter [Bacteroidetes bacterium]|nr:MFS transporter [Bacteroidota bacterium]
MSDKVSVFKRFPRTFWLANTMELFERWAWYGFFMLFANYLTQSSELGALGLSQTEKGIIMGVGTFLLYMLPTITGALADKYGFKRMLFIAFMVYTSAFLIMPLCKSFSSVFIAYIYLALGAALFKPIISATVAKTTDDKTASIGFGIFYMMVNIGAFVGPLFALYLKKLSFQSVFYISSAIIAFNFLVLLFYKEPESEKKDESLAQSLRTIANNIKIAFSDKKFVIFLLIIAGFWTMYNQLFFMLTVFIDQWVDTSSMYKFFEINWPWIIETYGTEGNQMQAEFITNFDALYIIIFQIMVSAVVMRLKPLSSMIIGFLVCTIGMSLTVLTQNPIFILVSLLIFGLGEMAGSPKITEYIGRIAPKDKVGLYMGFSYIPMAIGNLLAGFISGFVYQKMADNITIAQKEAKIQGFDIPELSDQFTKNDYLNALASKLDLTQQQLTNYLWETHHPNRIWIVLFSVGIFAVFMLYLYDRTLIRKKK